MSDDRWSPAHFHDRALEMRRLLKTWHTEYSTEPIQGGDILDAESWSRLRFRDVTKPSSEEPSGGLTFMSVDVGEPDISGVAFETPPDMMPMRSFVLCRIANFWHQLEILEERAPDRVKLAFHRLLDTFAYTSTPMFGRPERLLMSGQEIDDGILTELVSATLDLLTHSPADSTNDRTGQQGDKTNPRAQQQSKTLAGNSAGSSEPGTVQSHAGPIGRRIIVARVLRLGREAEPSKMPST